MSIDPPFGFTPWSQLEGKAVEQAAQKAEQQGNTVKATKLRAINHRVATLTGDVTPEKEGTPKNK